MRTFCNPFTAIFIGIAFGFSAVSGVHALTSRLESEALRQCRAEDWPAAKHAAMTAWCREFRLSMERYGRY